MAVVAIDKAGGLVEFNAAAEALFGYCANDVLNRPLADCLIPPESRDAHNQGFEKFLSSGRGRLLGGRPIELILMRADGSSFRARLVMSAVVAADGCTVFRSTVDPVN